MKQQLVFFAFALLAANSFAEFEKHYTLISPPAYVEDWQAYLDMRKLQRPDVEFKLKDAAEIYASYPFDPANQELQNGLPRNPAESIHTWIRETMKDVPTEDRGNYYFVLGGSFADAQTITKSDDARLSKYIPGVYVRPRFSPDANIQVGEPYYSISDMFFACLDVREGEWPWDANRNGKYADNQESGTLLNDYAADIIVSRIPIEKHSSGGKAVIAAFKAKVARVEDENFAGKYRFALAGGQCSNSGGRINVSDGNTLRDEHEFYDGGLNMFDPRHGGIWVDSELVPRKTVRNTTVKYRPVLEGNPMFMYTWGADHPSIDMAVAHFYSHDYDYMEYRDHGSAEDLYCKYINSGAYLSATGLTRMIISGFSCMTGYIDGPGISLAEAEILSPNGGTVASVHNSRYGVNYVGTDLKDNAGLSSSLQYLIKQGVLEKNMDIGQAWLYARQQFGATADLALFVSAEQLLLGDPLIKLPPAIPETTLEETEINVDKDTGYTTLNVKGGTTITGDKVFKVMQKLNVVDGKMLTFAADGGVGGEGVNFVDGKGLLALASPNKSYFVQPTGANIVSIDGSGITLDMGDKDPTFEVLKLCGEGGQQKGNVIRGRKAGQLKTFTPLAVGYTEVALGTVDAFKNGDFPYGLASVTDGALGITFNPNYGSTDSWEYFQSSIILSGGMLFVDRTETAGFGRPDKPGLTVSVSGNSSVKTMNGGKATLFGTSTFNLASTATLNLAATFAPDTATNGRIVINGGRTVVADGYGLSGEVEVNDGTLVLNELPLRNVTKLTLTGDSKLVIPMDEGGYSQILPTKGAVLDVSEATQVFELGKETTPISGKVSANGACFDLGKFKVWDGGNLTVAWMDGKKIYFPEIAAGGEIEVTVSEALTCSFIAFGNENGIYRFTGERLNLGSVVLSENVRFENDVYVATSTLVSGKESQFAKLITPSLQIQDGATVSATNVFNSINSIAGFRFIPLDTGSSGMNKLSVSELEFYNANGKINLSQATVREATGVGATSANLAKAWDGDVAGINFAQGALPWTVTFEDPSVMAKGKYYLEFTFASPIPMLTKYLVGATYRNQATESAKKWRIDVISDGETWVTVSEVNGVKYPGTGFNPLWVNSGNPFVISSAPTTISVAAGGTLALSGEATATIKLEARAKLKAVSGSALTLGAGSRIELPSDGYAIIDVSDLTYEEVDEGLTILSGIGITLTQDHLDHLTTQGKPWLKPTIVEGLDESGSLEVRLVLVVDRKPAKVIFR